MLKVSDFGLSCRLEPGHLFTKSAGTPTHMAPEVLARKYNLACDLWSCGVIVYELLCGHLPFSGRSREELHEEIIHRPVNFGRAEWLDVSQAAVSFTSTLLTKDHRLRCNPEQALGNQWIKDMVPQEPTVSFPPGITDDLRRFRSQNKLKRAALHVLASMVPEEELSSARSAFISLDTNGDGLFSVAELRERRRRCSEPNDGGNAKRAATLEIFRDECEAEDHELKDFTYTEFLAATFKQQNAIQRESLCLATFSSFDKNGDGKVSISELATGRLLGKLTLDEITDALSQIDADGDDNMDFEEFMRMMRQSSELTKDT